MADEAAAAAAAVAPLLERIRYGVGDLNSAGIIQKIDECVSHNKQMKLNLNFHDRFNATLAMQNKIVETSRHIKKITFWNRCTQQDEHRRCFTYFTRIVRGIIGNGKHLRYINCARKFGIEFEQANELANAVVQSNNNNNNGAIDSFHFDERNLKPVTFQPLWDVLLDSGVRDITFANNYDRDPNYNNNNIDFTGMETNISLKELDLSDFYMREDDFWSLFHSIKKNKGLEQLTLNYRNHQYLPTQMMRLFEEMMCENITLLHCCLYVHGNEEDKIYEVIQFHMKVNRMWKRHMIKRNEESTVAAMDAPDRVPARAGAVIVASTVEANNKKIFKMRLWLHLFMKKPVLRNTILFHLLREYPDDLVSNNDNNNELLRISSSNLAQNKRKRTNDDGENKNNDGTNDPDDIIDICDSNSDSNDGTDGTL